MIDLNTNTGRKMMDSWSGSFELIDPRLVLIDRRFQRDEKPALIAQIASNPDWRVFGAVTLFRRNGRLYAADGQQRVAGMLASPKPPSEIPAVVFDLKDVRDEAAVFVLINTMRKGLSPFDIHKANLTAKEHIAMAIEGIAAEVGFTLSSSQRHGGSTISAVNAVRTIYQSGGEDGLRQTLTVARDAFPDQREGRGAPILLALAGLVIDAQNDGDYRRANLTKALSKTTSTEILRRARALRYDFGGTVNANIRRAIRELCGLKLDPFSVALGPLKINAGGRAES